MNVKWITSAKLPHEPVDSAAGALSVCGSAVEMWTAEQAAMFLDSAMPHHLYALLYLFLSTGLRAGEATALRWSDVAENHLVVRRTITRVGAMVTFSTPKTERGERIVTLPPDTVAVLEAHKRRQDGERMTAGELYNAEGLVFCNELGALITLMALHHV